MGSEYLTANVKLLRFVGAWNDFLPGTLAHRAYHVLTALVLVAFLLHLATQFAFPFSHIDDVGDATEGFNLTTVYAVTFLKMVTLLRRRRDAAEVVAALGRRVGVPGEGETDVLEDGHRRAERLTRSFTALTVLGTAFFFLHAALTVAPTMAPCADPNNSSSSSAVVVVDEHCLEADRNLVYPAEFPFDTAGDSLGHVVALVFQLVGPGLFGNAVNVAADLLLVSLLIHLRARFLALGRLLRGLGSHDGTGLCQQHEELRYYLLCNYVRYHQELHRLSTAVGKLFSPLLFMQCFFSSVSYCIILFHLTMVNLARAAGKMTSQTKSWNKYVCIVQVSDDSVHLVKNALFLLTHMGQLLLFCWFGTQIYEESLSIMHAAYDTSWEDSSPRFKSTILLIIHRSQRPVLLMGFHVYRINLETFTSMLSSAFSYYTILRKMYSDNLSFERGT